MPQSRRGRPAQRVALLALLVLASCSSTDRLSEAQPRASESRAGGLVSEIVEPAAASVAVRVVDEIGSAVVGAVIVHTGADHPVDRDGRISLSVAHPVVGRVEADGYLPEPIVLSPWDTDLTVRMLATTSDLGAERTVYHFGGDTMLGRRYLQPTRDDSAVVTAGDSDSARRVVSSLAPLFAAADLRSVNLETVIGDLGADAAYPAKRFLLQSPPEIVDALAQLEVDVVTLGNNHLNDWEGEGVQATLRHLDGAGLARVGAGATSEDARAGILLEAGGSTVGMLSYTTVNGDFVNDSLPGAEARRPAELPIEEAWQYESRSFGFPGLIETADRRIGEVWSIYDSLEDELDEETNTALWSALREVYPELQDWVARRGHGGAAWYRRSAVEAGVADLRANGADVVVVQLHAGFQFAETPSTFVQRAAHASIDAGADLVVGHHPHVLQGFEFYRDKLIAYSLGNLVFDQDFLSTFSSAVLRTVFEGDELLEARVYPVLIDDYRPVPLSGPAAERVLRTLDARSATPAAAQRSDDSIVSVVGARRVDGVTLARLEPDATGARIVPTDRPADVVVLDATKLGDFEPGGRLVQAEPSATGVEFGRDLFGWGSLDDVTADSRSEGGAVWAIDRTRRSASVIQVADAPSGDWVLRLWATRPGAEALVRPVARVTRLDHRLVDEDGAAADDPASYSLRAMARTDGGETFARFDVYHFDDTDPTADPTSDLVRRVEIPLAVPADGAWHEIEIELPDETFAPGGGLPANAAMLYLGIVAPDDRAAEIQFDDVEVLEWRPAAGFPAGSWHEVDALRTDTTGPLELVVSGN